MKIRTLTIATCVAAALVVTGIYDASFAGSRFAPPLAPFNFAAMPHAPGFPPRLLPADLVITNATVATMIPGRPYAQAIAVRDGKIEGLGSDIGIRNYIGPHTTVMNVHGAFVTPGFFESHGHLFATAKSLSQLNVGEPDTWAGIVAMVKQAASKAKPGQWIIGHGWQDSKWTRVPEPNDHGVPLPATLDAASPRNPVLLTDASGHQVYVNAMALKLAGITDKTPNPVGGTILHDQRGHVIGVLTDAAAGLVRSVYQKSLNSRSSAEREAQRVHDLHVLEKNELSKGITFFVDQGETFSTIAWLKKKVTQGEENGTLPLRFQINVGGGPTANLEKHLAGAKAEYEAKDHFNVRAIGEDVSDGALGSETAWMLKPYTNEPHNFGTNVHPMPELYQWTQAAAANGYQVDIHAIGDRANREVLNMYQEIFKQDPAARALRFKIEHAQHLNPADIPRFAKLGVIASMQSLHECSDEPMVIPRIGRLRAEQGAYVWHKLISTGAMLVEGTDTPVEDTNPIPNFYCAVTRVTQFTNGTRKTFFPAEVKTPRQELQDYTWNGAYGTFQERRLGSLAPGKLADIDIWSGNLLTMPHDDILRTRVLYTIIGGKVVYTRKGASDWRKGELFPAMQEFDHIE